MLNVGDRGVVLYYDRHPPHDRRDGVVVKATRKWATVRSVVDGSKLGRFDVKHGLLDGCMISGARFVRQADSQD